MKKLLAALPLAALAAIFPAGTAASDFSLSRGEAVAVSVSQSEKEHVLTALRMLGDDLAAVLDARLDSSAAIHPDVIVGTVGINPDVASSGADLSALAGRREGFLLEALPSGQLLIAGSDSHGTVYGLMELSRRLGVSPWEWWADVTPRRLENFTMREGDRTVASPSVPYRGIFINDEDWGLMPWSGLTYEPEGGLHTIGPRTTARIFELLTRLRANTYWPAMHECTRPFFLTEGNRREAERYGIYIGGSHCEPMACSTAGEWPVRGAGDYDFVNNSQAVTDFWEKRLDEVAGQEIIYTLGMRGVHDSGMLGAKTVEEQKANLTNVLELQRRMLAEKVNPDVTAVPQVFIPYKEVLDIYNAGLEVPEDVTLMWCDDNYGYIRHMPTAVEQARKGGNGIYYHVSYWGRPHDYLWLATFSPWLLGQQMSEAWDNGIRDMWILNVGDIKPAEYQTELFMDMAWNIDSVRQQGVREHLRRFLTREFGATEANRLLPVMEEHYRLAYIRKPEFMGGTRTEEKDRKYWSTLRDLPWTLDEIHARMNAYISLSDSVEAIGRSIPADRLDPYFQLVKYPVQGAAQMNRKHLSAQLARHGFGPWEESDAAYDSIQALTARYNDGFHNNGKWRRMMDSAPRRLAVFGQVPREEASEAPYPYTAAPLLTLQGADILPSATAIDGLGYGGKAVALEKDAPASFTLHGLPESDRQMAMELRFLPTHPAEGDQLRVKVEVDGMEPATVDFATQGRSEEWKMNVLRNQAIREIPLPSRPGALKVTLTPLDKGVVLDQITVVE
ncbi:MAG: glycosyl hydrolase 115 family protein, partial [Muribaculaceae bacterium]|nr:glycosyl hydrolase 115 family protein [Muribaculaceae bacterium]